MQLIKNNHIESESIREVCAKNNKFYSDINYTNEPLVDLSQEHWAGYKMNIDGKEQKMMCHLESVNTMIFDKKQHNTFAIKCKAKNMVVTFVYADMLGLVKVEQEVDDYGIVGGIELKSIEANDNPHISPTLSQHKLQ